MKTIEPPAVAWPVSAPTPAALVPSAPLGHAIETGDFDGLGWTFRAGFGPELARISAAVWRNPESQPDWRLVKQNGSREVWRATFDGGIWYLKYYALSGVGALVKRLARVAPCQAEWRCGMYALRNGIAAVEPCGYTPSVLRRGRRMALLVTAGVEPAYPLHEFWQTLNSDGDARRRVADVSQLIESLADLIARAHQAGFEHLDMHAANILVQPLGRRRYRALFVDLHSARLGVPISDHAVVRNLAQLNQWFQRSATLSDRLRFLRAYCRRRDEHELDFEHGRALDLDFAGLVDALAREARRHAARLWAQRDRRSLRQGRYFVRLSCGGWKGMAFARCKHASGESPASRLVLDRAWWSKRLADPAALVAPTRGGVCKDSHSAVVARALWPHADGELAVILKRPRARTWMRRIARLLASRSRRGWVVGQALLNRDISTARPLAVLERKVGPVVVDSLLVTEAIPGAVDLEQDLRREHARVFEGDPPAGPHRWAAFKRELAPVLVRHVRRLHERGFVHRDCKAGNILVARRPALRLLWIDLDGIRRSRRVGFEAECAALVRLHVSLLGVPGITRCDRARFLRDYLARWGSTPGNWRVVWRRLSPRVTAKLEALARRRAWKRVHYGRE